MRLILIFLVILTAIPVKARAQEQMREAAAALILASPELDEFFGAERIDALSDSAPLPADSLPQFVFGPVDTIPLPLTIEELRETSRSIVRYIERRFGMGLLRRQVPVSFERRQSECGGHGMWAAGEITLYVDETTSRETLRGVFAHELGHELHFNSELSGTSHSELSQGVATWIAGEYWARMRGWQSIDEGARILLAEAEHRPLTSYSSYETCFEERVEVYTVWASFVGYLIDRFGLETLSDYFEEINSQGDSRRIGNPDLAPSSQAIYGRTLDELDSEWRLHIGANGK